MTALKAIVGVISGAIVGVVAVVAAVVVLPLDHNPAPADVAAALAGAERTLTVVIEAPGDPVALIAGANKAFGSFPDGAGTLEDAVFADGLALIATVRNETGEIIGIAAEMERRLAGSSWLRGRLLSEAVWTVVLPGRGAIFLHNVENAWRFTNRVALPARLLGRTWEGPWETVNTVGPRPDRFGIIGGGTGEFSMATGWFAETAELRRFTPDGRAELTMRLEMAFDAR